MNVLTDNYNNAVKDFIEKTDWDAFWRNVNEKANKEIEAYEMARAKSEQICHWFI